MSWISTAACVCLLACSWWRQRRASRRRSHPSSGPSCCCTATLTSCVTWRVPRWCTRTLWAPTRKSRWAGARRVGNLVFVGRGGISEQTTYHSSAVRLVGGEFSWTLASLRPCREMPCFSVQVPQQLWSPSAFPHPDLRGRLSLPSPRPPRSRRVCAERGEQLDLGAPPSYDITTALRSSQSIRTSFHLCRKRLVSEGKNLCSFNLGNIWNAYRSIFFCWITFDYLYWLLYWLLLGSLCSGQYLLTDSAASLPEFSRDAHSEHSVALLGRAQSWWCIIILLIH